MNLTVTYKVGETGDGVTHRTFCRRGLRFPSCLCSGTYMPLC